MSCSDLDKACQKVGRFLHDFADVEHEINELIAHILSLQRDAAGLVHSLDFFKKLNMLKIIVLDTAAENEQADLGKLFSSISEQNNHRQVVAHSSFEPAEAEAVQFKRTTANNGKITVNDPLWSVQMFSNASMKLIEIRDRLRKLRPVIVITISGSGKGASTEIIERYMYSSSASSA